MDTRSFLDGVLIGLAIDLPPFFLVDDGIELDLRTPLLIWGVLVMFRVALYVARRERFRIRPARRAMVPSQRVSTQPYRLAKQHAAANETDARSPASHQGN